MKKTIIILFTTTLLISSSCEEFLMTEPTGQTSVPEAYTSKGGIELALNGLYLIFNENYYGTYGGVKVYGITPAAIRYISYLTEASADDMMIRNTENAHRTALDRYTHDADNENIDRIYFSGFRGIKDCNSFLDNIETATVNDEGFLNLMKGQARAIRAYIYFTLVRCYGDLPVITTSEPRDSYFRENFAHVYQEIIIPDLEYAISNLPEVYGSEDLGRISKGGAQALLAEVYLTLSGRAYTNESVVDAQSVSDLFQMSQQEMLLESQKLCDSIISSGNYALHPDYKDLFSVNGNFSQESLWEIPRDGNQMTMELLPPAEEFPISYMPGDSSKTYQGLFPSEDPASGEIRAVFGWGRYVMSPNLQDLFDQQFDTRMNTVIEILAKDEITQDTIKLWYSNKFADSTAVYERNSVDPRDSRAYFKMIRYAHVLLMYAEVENEINSGPTPEGTAALTEVMERAYKGNESHIGTVPSDYAGFKLAVENERRKELYFEGYRWFDLVRTNRLEAAVEAAPYGPTGVEFPEVEDRHYLYPIPNKAFRLNPDYEGNQNPGW